MENFICYIDESGDEGFKSTSSKCFGFSAVIIRKENDLILPKKTKRNFKYHISTKKISIKTYTLCRPSS